MMNAIKNDNNIHFSRNLAAMHVIILSLPSIRREFFREEEFFREWVLNFENIASIPCSRRN